MEYGHHQTGEPGLPHLAHQFDTPEQQYQSGKLGMWIFLVTEILLFSGLFCAYAVYRANHPEIFTYAHKYLNKTLGAFNTTVLIFSSFTMAWAVRSAQRGKTRALIVLLVVTLLCACTFLGVKYVEYEHKWKEGLLWGKEFNPTEEVLAVPQSPAGEISPENRRPPNVQVFFAIYFVMTGLHGLHVIAGMALIGWMIFRAGRGDFSPAYFSPVDYTGLYWHLVDMIWIFLFPLLYLIH